MMNYGIWDGKPAVSKRFDDGRIVALLWDGKRWLAVHPYDFAVESTRIEQWRYNDTFPDVPTPVFPSGE
jgi:hypothetical protein